MMKRRINYSITVCWRTNMTIIVIQLPHNVRYVGRYKVVNGSARVKRRPLRCRIVLTLVNLTSIFVFRKYEHLVGMPVPVLLKPWVVIAAKDTDRTRPTKTAKEFIRV